MKTATKKIIQEELVPYIQWDGIIPTIERKNIHEIIAYLLTGYSNVYCEVSGEDSECPVFIVKSKSNHRAFIKIIVEYEL